jgi:hypothetical protein
MSVAAAITNLLLCRCTHMVPSSARPLAVSDNGTAHSTHKVPERGVLPQLAFIRRSSGNNGSVRACGLPLNCFGSLRAPVIVVYLSFSNRVVVAMNGIYLSLNLKKPELDFPN